MEENITIKGTLGLNYNEVGPLDVPTNEWKGVALLLNLHFFNSSLSEGSLHAEVYYPYDKKEEINNLLGKEVIVEGDYIGDETRGYQSKAPIIKKKLIIAKSIRPLL